MKLFSEQKDKRRLAVTAGRYYTQLAALLEKDAYARLTAEGMPHAQAEKAAEKAAFEDARSVLPNACDTRIVMTMNVRSLCNFFALRCCNRAQWEIRSLACEMLSLCRKAAPLLFAHAAEFWDERGAPFSAVFKSAKKGPARRTHTAKQAPFFISVARFGRGSTNENPASAGRCTLRVFALPTSARQGDKAACGGRPAFPNTEGMLQFVNVGF